MSRHHVPYRCWRRYLAGSAVLAALLATAVPADAVTSEDPCKQHPCIPEPPMPVVVVPGISISVNHVGMEVEVIDFKDGEALIVRKRPGRGQASGTIQITPEQSPEQSTVGVNVEISFGGDEE